MPPASRWQHPGRERQRRAPPGEPRDIALLLRSFEDVQIYERALCEAGISCYTVKGRGFFGCREVLDIAELLTAVNDPDDSLALAAACARRSLHYRISA